MFGKLLKIATDGHRWAPIENDKGFGLFWKVLSGICRITPVTSNMLSPVRFAHTTDKRCERSIVLNAIRNLSDRFLTM
ncbi:MAG TPA: hypothetical protein PLG41_21655, partial [Leptospiraceae bacterium]|nr:hypothetical protein [Leptospiraceae bacterium]